MLVLAAGCVGTLGTSDDGTDDDAEDGEITQAALLDGIDEVESYEFELTQTMETEMGEVTMTGDGAVDYAAQKLEMLIDTEMMGQSIEQQVYFIDDAIYTHAAGMGMDDSWMKMSVPEDEQEEVWADQETLEGQTDYIEGADVEETGTETVNGVETTVLELQFTEELREELEAEDEFDEQEMEIESVDYRLFVEESTEFLHKVEMDLTVEQMGQELTTETEMLITNHNEEVDITLPEAAEDAEDVGEFGDSIDPNAGSQDDDGFGQ